MNPPNKQCHVCGLVCSWRDSRYWDFAKLSKIYQVGYEDICQPCGDKATSLVNYWGIKKPEDREALRLFLVSGKLPMRDFSSLMFGGYF